MSRTREPLVSVVTPVYNAEQNLAVCIESILDQTYQNWEYIIVDNCSTDRSLEIANAYASKDVRIRVHENQTPLSTVASWNHALRQISEKSAFCKVVLADDWLFSDCLSSMVAVGVAHPSVGLVSAYCLSEDHVELMGLPYPSRMLSGHEICRMALLGEAHVFGSPTSMLIRSSLIRKSPNFYEESLTHADVDCCFRLMRDADFGFVHQVLTYVRHRSPLPSSVDQQFDSNPAEEILRLKRYGPIYLSKSEYKERLDTVVWLYYLRLARSILNQTDGNSWDLHRETLARAGFYLSRFKLLLAMVTVRGSSLFRLGETMKPKQWQRERPSLSKAAHSAHRELSAVSSATIRRE